MQDVHAQRSAPPSSQLRAAPRLGGSLGKQFVSMDLDLTACGLPPNYRSTLDPPARPPKACPAASEAMRACAAGSHRQDVIRGIPPAAGRLHAGVRRFGDRRGWPMVTGSRCHDHRHGDAARQSQPRIPIVTERSRASPEAGRSNRYAQEGVSRLRVQRLMCTSCRCNKNSSQ